MKNSLLIISVLLISIFLILSNFTLQEKPIVNYTINNSFPAFSGDTVNIDFAFDSKSDLEYFVANIESDLNLNIFTEKVKFARGRKKGNLNYSFIIPDKFKLENLLNFNFTVANQLSTEVVFISIPVYNLPHDVLTELELGNENEQMQIRSYFSSNNLILENKLLADISEIGGYSDFIVEDLASFSLSKENSEKSKLIDNREIIASNLTIPFEKLVKNKDELIAANFLSIPNLIENTTEAKIEKAKNTKKIKVLKAEIVENENSKFNKTKKELFADIHKEETSTKVIKKEKLVVMKKQISKPIEKILLDNTENEIEEFVSEEIELIEMKSIELVSNEFILADNLEGLKNLNKAKSQITETENNQNLELVEEESEILANINELNFTSEESASVKEATKIIEKYKILSAKLENTQREFEQQMMAIEKEKNSFVVEKLNFK